MKNLIITKQQIGSIVAILILLCGGSFYAGTKYGQGQNNAQQQAAGGRFGQSGGGRGMRGGAGGAIIGNILSKDDKSVTIQLRDGGSKIVFLSSAATIVKAVNGSVSDLVVGQQVMVIGATNADGSVTAQNIQIRNQNQLQPGQNPAQGQ